MKTEWQWYLLWGIVGALGIAVARAWFSPEARLRRRRRKSHSPIETTVRRPSVKFTVKTPPEKED